MNTSVLLSRLEADLPTQHFSRGAQIVAFGQPTDRGLIIKSGTASGFDGADYRQYEAGDFIGLIQFLALDLYAYPIIAKTRVEALVISRDQFRAFLDRQHQMTWPLSCMLAIDASKRFVQEIV